MENIQKTRPGNKKRPNNTSKWKERVVPIKRVTKVCKGGKKLSFRAVVIIGNEEGKICVGVGKADDIINAIKKSITSAKRTRNTNVWSSKIMNMRHVLARGKPLNHGFRADAS